MSEVAEVIPWVLLGVLLLMLCELLRALAAGRLFVPPQPRARLHYDWVLMGFASAFILLNLVPGLLRLFGIVGENGPNKATPTSRAVEQAIAINFAIIMILLSVMISRRKNRLADFGIELRGWLAEMRFGALGFLASLPLVIVVILIVGPFRSQETQNPLLILLRATGSERTILEVVFAAVISAPLAEEMLFRVAFQGMLQTRLSPAASIAIPAFIFASVHGPSDALPLLPLALILGGLYHLRRSYVANVTTHALFNATFLILALWQRQSS